MKRRTESVERADDGGKREEDEGERNVPGNAGRLRLRYGRSESEPECINFIAPSQHHLISYHSAALSYRSFFSLLFRFLSFPRSIGVCAPKTKTRGSKVFWGSSLRKLYSCPDLLANSSAYHIVTIFIIFPILPTSVATSILPSLPTSTATSIHFHFQN